MNMICVFLHIFYSFKGGQWNEPLTKKYLTRILKATETLGAREDLEKAWIARRMQLDQCLELQLYYR